MGWQQWCGSGWGRINKENCFPPPHFSELNLFGGPHFFPDNTQINSGKLSLYIKA